MKVRRLVPFLFAAAIPVSAQLYSFDPTGSTETYAESINPSGAITGYYNSASGFVRDAQGNIASFDPTGSTGTYAESINPSGAITGCYYDANAVLHGFVRDAQGNITSFDPTGSTGTNAYSINAGGAIAGVYEDAAYMVHGFVRDAQGNIASFDPTGSTGTFAQSINASGAIAGWYYDARAEPHGFVRDAQGNIASFDPARSTATYAYGVNASGAITGFYEDAIGQHGFVRDPQANINSFAPPGSTGTSAGSINASGAITGSYTDATGVTHGFAGRVPNTIDISKYTGAVSETVWQNAQQAGVANVIVQAWGGGSQNSLAEAQLLGAQSSGLNTGAYILLSYFSKDSAAYQVGKAIDAIGSAITDLKFIALDVEICCGEFTSWRASTSYAKNSVIMDPANHIQEVTTAGTSGPTAPAWNDKGGTTADGTVVWQDTGAVVINQADRIARISAAVSAIQAYGLPHGVVIYTDGPNKNWQTITGNCGTSSANNCSSLIALPLWDVEPKAFYGGDGLLHCGDGIAGLVPFTPYSSNTWQARSGNQYDFGLYNPADSIVAPSWDEYELGLAPAAKRACSGETNLFGLPASSTLDLDYFDPTLFQ